VRGEKMTTQIEPTKPPEERLSIKNEQGEIIIEVPLGQHAPLPLIPPVIRWLRKQAGLTQQELANRLGIWRDSISRWENGYQKVDVRDDVRVLRFLKVLAPWAVSVTAEGPGLGIKGSSLFQFRNLPYLIIKGTVGIGDWPVIISAHVRRDTWEAI